MSSSPAVVGLNVLIAVGGAVILHQSYRGSRRNDSKPLLLFGVGIGLLTFAPLLFVLVRTFLGTESGLLELVLLLRIGGLLSLLYAFSRA